LVCNLTIQFYTSWYIQTGVNTPLTQAFLWYNSSTGTPQDGQNSGAYICKNIPAPSVMISHLTVPRCSPAGAAVR
jgi:hypothetical protein